MPNGNQADKKEERLTKADKEKMLNFTKAGRKELEALRVAIVLTCLGIPLPYETYNELEKTYGNEWKKICHKIDIEWERRERLGKHSRDNIELRISDTDYTDLTVLHK